MAPADISQSPNDLTTEKEIMAQLIEITAQREEIAAEKEGIAATKQEIAVKEAEIVAKQEKIAAKEERIAAKQERIAAKKEELERKLTAIQSTRAMETPRNNESVKLGKSKVPVEPAVEDLEDLSISVPLNDEDIEKLFLRPATAKRLPAMSFSNDPECPKREPSLIDYGAEELQQRVEYAEKLGSRRVSPVTTAFAKKYRLAAECALTADKIVDVSAEDRDQLKRKVQELDYMLEVNRSLYYIPNAGMRYMLSQARKLRKLQFLATYGDYFALTCKEISAAVKEVEELKPHRSVFTRWWTEVQKEIREEREKESKPNADRSLTAYPTILAVKNCATTLKINEGQLFWTIEQYAERNATFHSDIDDNLQQGLYGAVAQTLHRDLKTVQQLNADKSDTPLLYVEALLNRLIAKWFIYEEDEEDMPGAWMASDAVRARKRRGKQQPTKAELDEIAEAKLKTGKESVDEVDAYLKEHAKWTEMLSNKRKWSGYLQMGAQKKQMMSKETSAIYDKISVSPDFRKFLSHMESLFSFDNKFGPESKLVERLEKEEEEEHKVKGTSRRIRRISL